jgi:hypothetical protein
MKIQFQQIVPVFAQDDPVERRSARISQFRSRKSWPAWRVKLLIFLRARLLGFFAINQADWLAGNLYSGEGPGLTSIAPASAAAEALRAWHSESATNNWWVTPLNRVRARAGVMSTNCEEARNQCKSISTIRNLIVRNYLPVKFSNHRGHPP